MRTPNSELMRAMAVMWVMALLGGAARAGVLFEDHFDAGMSPEWVSKAPTQWVQDGWLHNKDTNGWPRDSMATVHDSDPTWTDYEVTLRVDAVPTGEWRHANVLLRTDNFLRTSAGGTGRAYQLEFISNLGFPFYEGVSLSHCNQDTGEYVALAQITQALPAGPFDVRARLEGGHIQVWVDNAPIIDVVDPDPFLFGGIGVHNVWESEGRYDDIVVVPEPNSWAMLLLVGVGLTARKRRHGGVVGNPRV